MIQIILVLAMYRTMITVFLLLDTLDMANKRGNNQSTNNSITQVLAADAPVVPLSITFDEAILLLDQVILESVINEEEQDDD